MIEIKENKLNHHNILIPEKVYIRTIEQSREGEESEDGNSVKFWFSYKAYLKSKYDELGINTPTITIDNLPDSTIIYIEKSDSIEEYKTLAAIALYFNKKYIPTLTELGISIDDIKIIPF